MRCPKCDHPSSSVLHTDKAGADNYQHPLWFRAFSEHYPSSVMRSRKCRNCGERWISLELPLQDFKYIGKPSEIRELPLKKT
jgi:transcriptional regulator NrdR family protein